MDWASFHYILKGLVAFVGLLFASASLVALWRLPGVFGWRRSLRKELTRLEQDARERHGTERKALEVVVERCRSVWRSHLPRFSELSDLPEYVRNIARCYHPEADRPELGITTRRLLRAARECVNRLDLILQRRGFDLLRRVRIRHLRQSYDWYDRLNQYPVVRWLVRYQRLIRRIFRLRLYLVPDPFSWLFYLSNRLTVLMVTRYLLLDIYLFVGVMAVQAYGNEEGETGPPARVDDLERALDDLTILHNQEGALSDPRLQAIRSRLVGLSSSALSPPGIHEWKASVKKAVQVIARKYFPGSDRLLEEAALGPLLARCRFWITSVCETENLPVVRRLHRVRLDTLINLKSLSATLPVNRVSVGVAKVWNWYRMSKWPQSILRWIREGAHGTLAVNLGWLVVKRSLANFLCRYTFDRACKEIDLVYRESSGYRAGSTQRAVAAEKLPL
jgi:hypothetical protein